jgi:DNA repair protein RadD
METRDEWGSARRLPPAARPPLITSGFNQTHPSAACQGHNSPVLRPYQLDVIDRLRKAAGRHKAVLLVAPTGAGKTMIASAIVAGAVAKGRRVLFLAHRRELIDQAAAKLAEAGIDAGVILAGRDARPAQQVQVAAVQTLWARAFRGSKMQRPPADLIVVDEAHHVLARTWAKILAAYPGALTLGLSATPCRGDGRGLGNFFGSLVECPSVQELVDLGFLVPTKVYAPSTPDLAGVRVARGDFVEKDLAEKMDQAQLIGDIVEHWHRLAEGRKTVVFATGVGHSVHIRDEFRQSGVAAEHIDGSTPSEEREAILDRLSRGEISVVTNCMVLTEGWDQPDVACIVLARPTKHVGLYRQMIGRVLRPALGKDHALVLDHAGSTLLHGFVEDPITWTLDRDKRAENAAQTARSKHQKPGLKTCPKCSAVRTAGRPCPGCGWRPQPGAEWLETTAGDLAHLQRAGEIAKAVRDRVGFHRQLAWIAEKEGYKNGWVAHKYKEKFGDWPPFQNPEPARAEPATLAWVRSRQIAYAKSRKAHAHG